MSRSSARTRQDPATTLGVRLMKRRVAPVLIATVALAAMAVQAQAHSASLSVASGRAAITRFAGELTYSLSKGPSAMPMSWEVFGCAKRGASVICTAQWLSSEKCSVEIQARASKPAIRVTEVGTLRCTPWSGGE
jgi:hypothetical protein